MAVAGSLTYDTELDSKGFNKGLKGMKGFASGALKGIGAGVAAATAAFTGLVVASVKARGEIEQSIGGVETLFKDSADKVIQNANNAYKTAGMSANEYMQNVTSFSASLLQSVAGDTEKAADIADMAMVDMSDNANKMGTDMEMIKNAYQGFAKQNYTMLDNLKLGYGGTKTEMERLLADAQKITGVKYDINSLKDVYEAIHVIQGELGITGTTAKEATQTLEGSMGMLKASWENFLSGSGNLGQVTESLGYFFENVMRILNEAIPSIIENLVKFLPELMKLGSDMLMQIVNGIVKYLPQLYETGLKVVLELINGIVKQLPTLIPQAIDLILTIVMTLLDNIDLIIDAGIQLIIGLAEGLINALPELIDKIPVIIDKLVNAIVNNLPKIIEMGIILIVKLAEGLIRAIPQLISKIPQIMWSLINGIRTYLGNMQSIGRDLLNRVKDGISNGISGLWNIGRNIVQGLWNGITGMGGWLYSKVRGFARRIIDNMKSALGIHSPSRVMRDQVGQWIPKGLAVGIDANTDSALKSIDYMNDEIMAKMRNAVAQEQAIANFGGMNNSVSQILSANSVIKVENNNTLELDGEKIYKNQEIIKQNKNLQYGFGGAF